MTTEQKIENLQKQLDALKEETAIKYSLNRIYERKRSNGMSAYYMIILEKNNLKFYNITTMYMWNSEILLNQAELEIIKTKKYLSYFMFNKLTASQAATFKIVSHIGE